MTLSIKTLSIKTLSIKTLSITIKNTSLSIMTFTIMTIDTLMLSVANKLIMLSVMVPFYLWYIPKQKIVYDNDFRIDY